VKFLVIPFLDQKLYRKGMHLSRVCKKKMFINNILNSYVVLCEDFFLLSVLLSLYREFNTGNNFGRQPNPVGIEQ